MAEISYPFSEENEDGGTTAVSEAQWQSMATMWGGDRVDFRLTAESYSSGSLPFAATVINGRDVEVAPGRAWVGGFYYQLTASASVSIEANPTDRGRRDTIVLRADVPKGSVNLAVVKGQPASSPIAPQPQRSPGQVWEMVLYEVTVPAQNGTVQPAIRAPFDIPPRVGTPWNTQDSARFLQPGSLVYDLDNNGGDSQHESFVGRDGYVVARHFGKSRSYTPTLANVASQPSSGVVYRGRWRWLAPNMCYFTVMIDNTSGTHIRSTAGYGLGIRFPHQANGVTGQIITGHLRNLERNGGLPNLAIVQGNCWQGPGAFYATMYTPATASLQGGLDLLTTIPARSTLYMGGTIETNVFNEG